MPRRAGWMKSLAALFALAPLLSGASLPSPRTVNLTAHDGVLLKATYFAAAKPGPAVLLLHQCDGQRKQWDTLAKQLTKSGINVLAVDYRGFGESQGDRYDAMTPAARQAVVRDLWPSDVDLAYSYLVWQPGVQRDKIAAGGASCGVNNAIQLARRHSEVKALMLLSGPTDRDGRLFLRSSNLPLFAAAADDDKYRDSVETTEWLAGVSNNKATRFAHYANGHHGAEMFDAHPEMAGVVANWLIAVLEGHSNRAPKVEGAGLDPQVIHILDQIDSPGGAEVGMKALEEARKRDADAILFPESYVNQLGYEHLQMGDKSGAVAIMRLNVSAYPNSANAYDSLSDVYLADGQKDLALTNAKRALELLQTDTADPEERKNGIRGNAEGKIRQLQSGQI